MRNRAEKIRVLIRKNKHLLVCLLILSASVLWIFKWGSIAMIDNSPDKLWVIAPSTVEKDQEFEFHVQCWDDSERLSSIYDGKVRFDLISFDYDTLLEFEGSADLPDDYQFTAYFLEQGLVPAYKISALTGLDCGRHSFTATIESKGIHYIRVKDNKGNVALSNPIYVKNKHNNDIYWGDIHGHSALCDGSGYLDEAFRFSKEVAYLDFAAYSTHDDWTDHYGSSPHAPYMWEIARAAANRWNSPGEFATLVSYEWTSQGRGYGHMCVYYKGSEGEMLSSSYDPYKSQDLLWDSLRDWKEKTGSDVITIPHHTGFKTSSMYYDWSYYDEEFVPLVEMISCHGASEKINGIKGLEGNSNDGNDDSDAEVHGYHVQDALAMGYKVGFMASSDTHDGRLGHSLVHTEANTHFQYPYSKEGLAGTGFRFGERKPGGLIAVYAKNLERSTVFDAIKDRACYASSDIKRPILYFSINNVTVGDDDNTVIVEKINSTRNIELFVAIDAGEKDNYIKSITLVKNNEDIDIVKLDNTLLYRYSYTDTSDITGMEYTHGEDYDNGYKITDDARKTLSDYDEDDPPSTDGADVYYIRIVQHNNEAAWIGPIWVEVE